MAGPGCCFFSELQPVERLEPLRYGAPMALVGDTSCGRHCRNNEDLPPTLVLCTDNEVEEYFEYSAPKGHRAINKGDSLLGQRLYSRKQRFYYT